LTLTPKGKKLFNKVVEAIELRNKKILEPLSAEEVKTLDHLLDKMVSNVAIDA
jgi:DNA-binding MarR family transcriptional regulator